MTRWWPIGIVCGIAAGVAAWWAWQPDDDAEIARRVREARVAFAAPHWSADQVAATVAASDAATGEPHPTEVRSLLAAVEVDPRDVAAFHAANSDAFGGRSLAASQVAAEQLWRVHLARAELGLTDPENGLVYP
jgi:hypothetical protein